MKKVIRFFGEVIICLADIIRMLRNILKFVVIIGICLGVLIFTMLATFEAFHFIQPTEYISEYGRPLDIFAKDIWAWIVAGLGWVTMLYGVNKMLVADREETKRDDQLRKEDDTWLGSDDF